MRLIEDFREPELAATFLSSILRHALLCSRRPSMIFSVRRRKVMKLIFCH